MQFVFIDVSIEYLSDIHLYILHLSVGKYIGAVESQWMMAGYNSSLECDEDLYGPWQTTLPHINLTYS